MTKYTCAYVEAQKLTFVLNTKLNTYELHNLWCLHCKKLKRDRFQFRYKERPIDHGAEMRGNIS